MNSLAVGDSRFTAPFEKVQHLPIYTDSSIALSSMLQTHGASLARYSQSQRHLKPFARLPDAFLQSPNALLQTYELSFSYLLARLLTSLSLLLIMMKPTQIPFIDQHEQQCEMLQNTGFRLCKIHAAYPHWLDMQGVRSCGILGAVGGAGIGKVR